MDSYKQFLHVYDLMRDTRNGLYYHAYDDSRQMFWCDKVTGLSDNFWLRALGWYAMALIDTMDVMPVFMSKEKEQLRTIYQELIDSMEEGVFSLYARKNDISRLMKKYKVSNLKTEHDGVELRIIAGKQPSPDAVRVDANLEDVFLYYFGEKAGEENVEI